MLYTWRSCSRAIPQVPCRPARQDQGFPHPPARPCSAQVAPLHPSWTTPHPAAPSVPYRLPGLPLSCWDLTLKSILPLHTPLG